jgi:hypothetical protein
MTPVSAAPGRISFRYGVREAPPASDFGTLLPLQVAAFAASHLTSFEAK